MKISRPLAILLVLNVAMIACWIWSRSRSTTQGVEASPSPTPVLAQGVPAPSSSDRLNATNSASASQPFQWSELESKDYREYVERLRAIGCPEQTIRDLIIADIDKLYAARIRSLHPLRKTLNFWESEETELANNYDTRVWQQKEREIEREKAKVLKDLLGVDLAAERQRNKGQVDAFDRRLGFLPEDKRSEIRDIVETFEEQERAIREKTWDTGLALTAEERQRLRELEEKREERLGRLLTPEQKELFDLSSSPTAEALRHDLYGMGATEEEFRAVFDIRKGFEAAWPKDQVDVGDEATLKAWGGALMEVEEKLKSTLGEERFAMYQRGQDYRFHELNGTISRFGLPRDRAAEAYEYLRLAEQEGTRVMNSQTLTPDQKTEISARIADEADRAMRELIGEGPFNYYKRRTR
ncbi:MAG: hypothetical protein HYR88_15125 [Verrucomicrobia bacterium]|nr:hypothetical protein [Verrucomicrobiota bacterium]MBI3866976.1 hypothetical protein [Verrucomicrobiota bacterium]